MIPAVGEVACPDRTIYYPNFAKDLLVLMENLLTYKAHILGFSMGGIIALLFAKLYPEKIGKLIIGASFAVMNPQAKLFPDVVQSVYESGASA